MDILYILLKYFICLIKVLNVLAATTILDVNGHGRLIDPPSRSALWRFTDNPLIAPHARRIKENFGDDNVNCGGVGVMIILI